MTATNTIIANPSFQLSGVDNLRELGNYPTITGHSTQCGRILRSDGLQDLSRADKAVLYEYGVRQIIDLRSQEEKSKHPYHFEAYPDIKMVHLPIFVDITSLDGSIKTPDTLAELYVAILEGAKENLTQTIRLIGEVKQGCTIFHCAAGKDRTGLLSMLLLLLADVPEEIVVADYCTSCDNMALKFIKQRFEMYLEGKHVNDALFHSSSYDIMPAIHYIYTEYGTVENYLALAGLSKAEIIRARRTICPNGL